MLEKFATEKGSSLTANHLAQSVGRLNQLYELVNQFTQKPKLYLLFLPNIFYEIKYTSLSNLYTKKKLKSQKIIVHTVVVLCFSMSDDRPV